MTRKKTSGNSARRKTSSSKPSTPRNLIRGAIGEKQSWGRIHDALEAAKIKSPTTQFAELMHLAALSSLVLRAFPAAGKINQKQRIQSPPPLASTSFHRELYWAVALLAAPQQKIDVFVSFREEFIDYLVRGQYSQATLTLNKIDEQCGHSLWSVENRIAIIALAAGFDEQHQYISQITTKFPKTFISFYAANVSERNEKRVSFKKFEERLRLKSAKWAIGESHKKYILYKLIGERPKTALEAADILSYEGASSPIDLYETLISVLSSVATDSSLSAAFVTNSLKKLAHINDHCISNLISVFGEDMISEVASHPHIEHFLKGEYSESKEKLTLALEENPRDIRALALIARIAGANSAPATADPLSIVGSLYTSIFNCDERVLEAQDELKKLSVNLSALPFSTSISSAAVSVNRTALPDIDIETAIRSKQITFQEARIAFPNSFEKYLGPQHSSSIEFQYETLANNGKATSESLALLSPEARHLALAFHHGRKGEYDRALNELEILSNTRIPRIFDLQARIHKSWLQHRSGDIYEALRTSCKLAIENYWLTGILPILPIIKNRGYRELKEMRAELCLSISFFLYSQVTRDGAKDVALQVAWKQFLAAHKLEKASDIKIDSLAYDKNELIFFLVNVCCQEVMELGRSFKSPEDLDHERLSICIVLAQIDPENITDYDSELIELTRRASIEEGVKRVDSSRVYVDLLGVARWCHTNLNEAFLRYLDYAGAGLHVSAEELEKDIVKILKTGAGAKELEDFLDNYDVSADSLLVELIENLANAFMTLPRYGLDAFLGSRVRHGSLEGVFRNPLENKKLVTKIDSTSGQYEQNLHWLESISDVKTKEKLNIILTNFSHSVDALLDRAVSRYIYVKTDSNKDGLFTLWHGVDVKHQQMQRWLLQAKIFIAQGVSIEQVFYYCSTKLFWPALATSLGIVRHFIKSEIAEQIIFHLKHAREEALQILPPNQSMAIIATMNAAEAEISTAAAKLSSWFHPPQESDHVSSYRLKTAIEIGLRSIRTIRKNFDPDVVWSVDEKANVVLHRYAFETINDVSYLIFGNIAKHSGFIDSEIGRSPASCIEICISARPPNFIDVRVVSSVSDLNDIEDIEQKVQIAKDTILARKFEETTRRNKGTGLVRLASIINYEGSEEKRVDFGLEGDRRFFVYFSVPVYFLSSDEVQL